MNEEKEITIKEALVIAGVARQTIQNAIKTGRIPAYKSTDGVTPYWKMKEKDLRFWIANYHNPKMAR